MSANTRESRDRFAEARALMVERQLRRRGIRDERLLEAFAAIPRERFVDQRLDHLAYFDQPLEIGFGQTISQPYIVALMIEAVAVRPSDRVLEVGAGSGYAAAILSRLARSVVAIERVPELAAQARERLARLGFDNVEIVEGDGTLGWPDGAPYDAILAAASGREVPPSLVEQLAPGGRLVMPMGAPRSVQTLLLVTRHEDGTLESRDLGRVRFVPLIGEQGWSEDDA